MKGRRDFVIGFIQYPEGDENPQDIKEDKVQPHIDRIVNGQLGVTA